MRLNRVGGRASRINLSDKFVFSGYKINLIRTLTFRCLRICSSSSLLRSSLSELRKLLSQNGCPAGIVNYNINDVLNRQQNRQREQITTVPKKEVLLILPLLGLQSNVITKHFHHLFFVNCQSYCFSNLNLVDFPFNGYF